MRDGQMQAFVITLANSARPLANQIVKFQLRRVIRRIQPPIHHRTLFELSPILRVCMYVTGANVECHNP